jgi:general stress protein 26
VIRNAAVFLAVLAASSNTGAARQAPIPTAELRLAPNPRLVVDSARSLMRADSAAALVTIDPAGQPRVRTVRAFLDPVDPARLESGVTVWIMTRFSTRKVEQIRAHPQVTLYFNDDDRQSYASIMGTAIVHTDPSHPGAKRHYNAEYVRFFWPDFPRDFVMLEIRPRWLEYLGPGIANDPTTWRPQAVLFEP